MKQSRLFWVVSSPKDNKKIFETKREAEEYAKKYGRQETYRIGIAEVRNFYQEKDGAWNYNDEADTFDYVVTIIARIDKRIPYSNEFISS